MDSLEKICLHFVARNVSQYPTKAIKDLSHPVLEQLSLCLSAYQLNRLHDAFTEAGIPLGMVWKKHLAFHWNKSSDSSATIFNSDHDLRKEIEPRSLFLERLFQKILGNLHFFTTHCLKVNLMAQCRHDLAFHCTDTTELNNIVPHKELLQDASHVRVLTLAATSSMVKYLLDNRDLLQILQCFVQRLNVYCISQENYKNVRELVKLFVQEGCLSEFAIFRSQLPSDYIKELLMIVSGHVARSANDECPKLSASSGNRIMNAGVPVSDRHSKEGSLASEQMTDVFSEPSFEESEIPFTDNIFDSLPGEDLFDVALASTSNISYENFSKWKMQPHDLDDSPPPSLPHPPQNSVPLRSFSHVFSTERTYDNANVSLTSSVSNIHPIKRPSGESVSFPESASASGSIDLPAETSEMIISQPGCTSLTLAYFKGDFLLRHVLLDVLSSWKNLRKLAFFEVSVCSSAVGHQLLSAESNFLHSIDQAEQKEEMLHFDYFIHETIKHSLLTHIVIYGSDFFSNIFISILSALRSKQNFFSMSYKPMEEISIYLSAEPTITLQCSTFEGGFYGTVCLDFCQSPVAEATSHCIISWIQCDHALKRLHLPHFPNSRFLQEAIEAVKSNSRIEVLRLDANTFDLNCGWSLIAVIESASSLCRLSLAECDLSKDIFANFDSFVKAICEHHSLRELNLEGNRLEGAACTLLKEICLSRIHKQFDLLDLSYNRIDGRMLIETMKKIRAAIHRFPILELNISGNIFKGCRDQLVCNFARCVNVFLADDPSLSCPAGSLADHISLM